MFMWDWPPAIFPLEIKKIEAGGEEAWLGMEKKDVSVPVRGTGPAGALADASIPVSLHLGPAAGGEAELARIRLQRLQLEEPPSPREPFSCPSSRHLSLQGFADLTLLLEGSLGQRSTAHKFCQHV